MSKTISAEEVESRLDDVFVVDIRPTYSYEEEHIVGSHNLPIYDQLSGGNFIGLDASLNEIPKEQEIVIVCFSGSKAELAATHLRKRGYDAKRMVGGIGGWPYATTGTVASTESSVELVEV